MPGATMAEKLVHLNKVDESLRRLLCSEPRSGPAGSFCLLVPPSVAEADIGFIVLQPDRAYPMSGSNAMCAVTALLETDMLPMREGETIRTGGLIASDTSGPFRPDEGTRRAPNRSLLRSAARYTATTEP